MNAYTSFSVLSLFLVVAIVLLDTVSARGALSASTYMCDLPGETVVSCECLTEDLSAEEKVCDSNLCFVKKFLCEVTATGARRTVDNTSGEWGKNGLSEREMK